LDKLFAGIPEFLVTPLFMGPVCIISQGRFKKPVRPASVVGDMTIVHFRMTPEPPYIDTVHVLFYEWRCCQCLQVANGRGTGHFLRWT